jgi:DNA mismatch repair ATPase MutS
MQAPSIRDLTEQLHRQIIESEEAAKRLSATKASLLTAMLETSNGNPETIRAHFGQIQPVRTAEWTYRDASVTEQKKMVEKAEKALKEAKAILKGFEEAAKAAYKAKETGFSWSLRVVKGK